MHSYKPQNTIQVVRWPRQDLKVLVSYTNMQDNCESIWK